MSSASTMISSVKYNMSLRRTKRVHNKFSKKTNFKGHQSIPLSKEENLLIIEENKMRLASDTRNKHLLALFVVLLYGGIAMTVVYLFV